MRAITVAATIILVGCATKIVPEGRDTYKIGAAHDGCGKCEARAVRYCAELGKVMVVKDVALNAFTGRQLSLTFSCVDAH
jgi:hypothetical protein